MNKGAWLLNGSAALIKITLKNIFRIFAPPFLHSESLKLKITTTFSIFITMTPVYKMSKKLKQKVKEHAKCVVITKYIH